LPLSTAILIKVIVQRYAFKNPDITLRVAFDFSVRSPDDVLGTGSGENQEVQ
jgi:hypothetical protein